MKLLLPTIDGIIMNYENGKTPYRIISDERPSGKQLCARHTGRTHLSCLALDP
jgi:hypothetical protein